MTMGALASEVESNCPLIALLRIVHCPPAGVISAGYGVTPPAPAVSESPSAARVPARSIHHQITNTGRVAGNHRSDLDGETGPGSPSRDNRLYKSRQRGVTGGRRNRQALVDTQKDAAVSGDSRCVD